MWRGEWGRGGERRRLFATHRFYYIACWWWGDGWSSRQVSLKVFTTLVHRVKQDCTCELQMSNRSFHFWVVHKSLLPISSFSHRPLIISTVFPWTTGCITAASQMLLAESQLSLLSQSDGPGHTSGNPWQGSPLPSLLHPHPHPLYRADWIKISRWLFYASWKNKTNTEPKHRGEICLSSRSWAEVTHALAQGLFSASL